MKWSRLVVFGLLLSAGVFAVGGFFTIRSIPPVAEQVPDSPVSVQVVSPLNGEFINSGASVLVQTQASSPNNVVSVEIWGDGRLLDSQNISQQFPQAGLANFQWTSVSPGVHVLFARATDASGFTNQSNLTLITVKAVKPLSEYSASEGDSLASIADLLQISPEELGESNPEIDPAAPFNEGTAVQLPLPAAAPPTSPPEEIPSTGGAPAAPGNSPGPVVYKFKGIIGQWLAPTPLPTAPLLSASFENCSQVKLTVVPQSANEDGYFVYRWVFGEPGLTFSNIAVLGLGGAEMQPVVYTEPLNGLAAFYYVSAFNMTGEASSAPISVTFDETCLEGQGEHQPILIDLLSDFETSIPVSQSYCYYSTMPGEWQRFPSRAFDFFTPGEVFLEPMMLNSFPPNPVLQMECWGWDGPTLQFLGTGEAMMGPEPAKLVGTNFSFDLPPLKMLKSEPGGQDSSNSSINDAVLSLGSKQMPPPINLREAEDRWVCINHISSLYPGQCDDLLNKQVKQEYVLIWDWETITCWPGADCPWLTDANGIGFNVYQVGKPEPVSAAYELGTVIPLPWGYACYYVTAFTDTAIGTVESGPSNQFCPDQKNPPQELVLKPTDYLTLGKQSLYQCMFPPSNPASTLQTKQVMVGVIDTACWDFRYQGAVMFDLTQLNTIVGGYSLQSAFLRFKQASSFYQNDSPGYEMATNEKPLCGVEFGSIAGGGEWTNYDPASAVNGGYSLLSFISNSEAALPAYSPGQFEVNVTYFVQYYGGGWNGGFGFNTNLATLYDQNLFEEWNSNRICWNQLQDFELVIRYYPLSQ